ncbi:uncharacterized protein LOC136086203 [Hydra vulgaris]|uniref:Uncharacterized protein LOC136086203 n=1 Tax=Hydra vulgaris TaxID=6087 RepID=A0ABM4CRP9_HYDVU
MYFNYLIFISIKYYYISNIGNDNYLNIVSFPHFLISICSNMSFKFAIVEFISNYSVATIPVSWFVSEEEEECFFPSKVSRNTIKKLVSDRCESLLYILATYERAEEKVTKPLSQSDIGTDQDAPVRKQTSKRSKHGYSQKKVKFAATSQSPPRINSNVQYNPSSSTSVQSLQITPCQPPCTTNSPVGFSVGHVSPAICSTPTTSSTSQHTPLTAHETTLVSVAEVVPDIGQDIQADLCTLLTDVPSSSSLSAMNFHSGGSNLRPYLEAILKTVQEIKVTQTIHLNILNALVQQKNVVSQASQLSRGIIPIKELHDFQLLNDMLKTDYNISKALVSHLSSLGGRKVFEAVARMMKAVMPDNIALQFNYSGTNKKKRNKGN